MGDAALGVAVLAPEKGSKEWNDLVDLREKSDRFFYLGILLTAVGTLLLGASSLQSHERDVLPAGKKGDSTPWWITITVIAGVTSIALRYLFAKEAFLAGGQTVILGVTAIALFLYARDTRLMAAATARQVQISEEMNYRPLARFSVLQIPMVVEELRCPMSIDLLRHIPFVAKVDLRLEVNGQLVPTESPLYDGEKEWVVYAGFRHLPGDVSRAILNNLPSGVNSLEEYLSAPENVQGNIANRVVVTPIIIYQASGAAETTVTSAARSYLTVGQMKVNDGNSEQVVVFQWAPDVQRDRYRSMTWQKEGLSDFQLEGHIEAA